MTKPITDPKLLAQLTNQAIPVDSTQSIQVNRVEDQGSWQHETIVYDSVWADGVAIPLVLRSYHSPFTYWQIQDPNKRDREWAVLRRLRLEGFPVPRPLARGEAQGQRRGLSEACCLLSGALACGKCHTIGRARCRGLV